MRKKFIKIILKPGKEKSVLRFHPWVFSGAIKEIEEEINEGDIAEVFSSDNQYLATGHYQPSSIAVRLFSFKQENIDEDFWRQKLADAINLRQKLRFFNNKNLNVFRLVNAEGDWLPGLIIDCYNGVPVFQAHSVGMHQHLDLFKKLLIELMGNYIKAIYDKSSKTLPHKAQFEIRDEYVYGKEEEIVVNEYGNSFFIDVAQGQKTGFYIDQRENRNLLKDFCHDKKVLNTFSYSGGFSVYALKSGASCVHSIDSSIKAIELTEKNIELNFGKSVNHLSYSEDVFGFLDNLKEKYDVIILDPPAFAKHINALKQGLKGYARINKKALENLNPGGILFTFSCSQIVSREDFKTAVFQAAVSAQRDVKILYQLSQPADHPVSIFHSEGEYLKGLVLYVE
ncbi:class I SAM-dependent rRNA methyltransferase [bacterium]|nr:class I SAM-dependent rRNA methyltransferase [bacterium]